MSIRKRVREYLGDREEPVSIRRRIREYLGEDMYQYQAIEPRAREIKLKLNELNIAYQNLMAYVILKVDAIETLFGEIGLVATALSVPSQRREEQISICISQLQSISMEGKEKIQRLKEILSP